MIENSTPIEKLCKDCCVMKCSSLFSRDKSKKSGLATYCKNCQKKRMDSYYRANAEIISRRATKWCKENKERYAERAKRRRAEQRERLLPLRRAKHKYKMSSDVLYRLNHSMRASLRRLSLGCSSSKNLPYTTSILKQRIECQFKSGMSWDNYGEWEIDHKIPISVFLSRGERRPQIINALSNLQPMWKFENRSKGARSVG